MSVRELIREAGRPGPSSPRNAQQQATVTLWQLAAGAGNLFFAFVMVRLLAPGDYAQLAAFLALYLLLHVVTGSLSAPSALDPTAAGRIGPRLWRVGIATALVAIAASVPLAGLLGVEPQIVNALALAAPVSGVLAVERGRLYGTGAHRTLVATLVAEPAVRLTLGLALGALAGVGGAAIGVSLGGWAALAVAAPSHFGPRWTSWATRSLRVERFGREPVTPPSGNGSIEHPHAGAKGSAFAAFLGAAIVMNQDLLWANRLLPGEEAGRFAVLSTLGGLAAFATSTIPLTFLGQGGGLSERTRAFRTAVGWAIAVGGFTLLFVAAAPRLLVSIAFGSRFASVSSLAARYVLAMAFLGVARVLIARLCLGSHGRIAAWIVGTAAVVQAILIAMSARDVAAVATATLTTTALLLAALATCVAITSRSRAPRPEPQPGSGRISSSAHLYGFVGISLLVQALTRVLAPPLRSASRVAGSINLRRKRSMRDELRRTLASIWALRTDRGVQALVLITAAGLLIRLVIRRSIWLDEAIAVSQARASFDEMMQTLRFSDVHPPLHSTILWATVRILGTSELAVRLPSIIAGTLLIPLLYAAARDLYGRLTGVVAALFAAGAPFLVWYSQEARMYALYMLFAVAATWGQIRALRRGRRIDWALYAVATALMLWTQYFAVLQVLVQQAIFAAAAWRRRRSPEGARPLVKPWIGSMVFVALVMLPLVPILRDQLVAYGSRGAPLSDVPARAGGELDPAQQHLSIYAVFANLVWAVWGYHSDATMAALVALWPLVMLLLLFLLGRRQSWITGASVAILVVPIATLFLAGLAKRDLFELRYFAAAAPLLVLLGARVVTAGFRRSGMRVLATLAVCTSLAAGLLDQQTNGANPRIYDFRGALSTLTTLAEPSDQVVYAPFYLEPVIDYYAPGIGAQKLAKEFHPDTGRRVFLLASFLDKKEVSGRVGGALGKLRGERRLEREIDLPRVKVWVFR